MNGRLDDIVAAFSRWPVGTKLVGANRNNGVLVVGTLMAEGFGVISRASSKDFGRAYVALKTPGHVLPQYPVWLDTLTDKPTPAAPARKPVVAHLLVEVTLNDSTPEDACQLADGLIERTLNMAKQVDRFYIRQLGTAPATD